MVLAGAAYAYPDNGNNNITPAGGEYVIVGDNINSPATGVVVGENAGNVVDQSVVVGNHALVSGTTTTSDQASVAIGFEAAAQEKSVVIGAAAAGMGMQATVIGSGAMGATNATALGTGANGSDNSVAVGGQSTAAGVKSTAVGQGSRATGSASLAIGADSRSSGSNSVALGSGSNDGGRQNVVSVGSTTQQRAISNVTEGTFGSDAATVSQLPATISYAGGVGVVTMGNANAKGGNAAPVRVANVADGTADNDAVNFSQLKTYTSDIYNFANGTAGLVQQVGGAPGNGLITVGGATGGTSVNFAGTAGARRLSGVAAGVDATDAVNVSQLQAATASITNGVLYDNPEQSSVTLGGVGASSAVALTNVAAGLIAADSTDAVNGSQLYDLATQITNITNESTVINQAVLDKLEYVAVNSTGAAANAAGNESVAIGGNSSSSGANSVAIGSNSNASANDSMALGANAVASGTNSVALGQGSVASDPNTVSVGNAATGMTRTISNVAPGVNGTDAVNVNQMNSAVSQGVHDSNRYTDRGVASALAIPSIPFLQPGDKWVGAAVGGYGSAAALGVAAAYQATASLNVGAGVASSTGGSTAYKVQAGYRW